MQETNTGNLQGTEISKTVDFKIDSIENVEPSSESDPINDALSTDLTTTISPSRTFDKKRDIFRKDLKRIRLFKDEFETFGESIASQLRLIKDPYAISMAKFNIQKILFEAETGMYSVGLHKASVRTFRRPSNNNIRSNQDLKDTDETFH